MRAADNREVRRKNVYDARTNEDRTGRTVQMSMLLADNS